MIDTHAHLYLAKAPVDTTIAHAQSAGVTHIINVATSVQNAQTVLETAQSFPMTYPTAGIHPCEAKEHDLAELDRLLHTGSFVAVGEAGLDYYRSSESKDSQIVVFEAQLKMAQKYNLPIIIHNRQADEDMGAILTQYPDVKKVLHCYSSSWEFASELLNTNTYFSFTGSITYAKKGKTINALRNIPMDLIMLETDMPYLTPAAFQGKENSSAYLNEIAIKIAEVKECEVSEVIQNTTATAMTFFNL